MTTTFSPTAEDLRFRLALNTVREAVRCGYPIIVVDGSPFDDAKRLLEEAGAVVFKETTPGMGASRRQVLRAGLDTGAEVVVWLEPEKYPLVSLLGPCVKMVQSGYDLVVPARRSLESLPSYQELSELRANWELGFITKRAELDLMFGPRVMSRNAAELFLSYDGAFGDHWHILFLPVLRALRVGMSVMSVVVDYTHPAEQTAAEEADPKMPPKRLAQRQALVPAMREEADRLGLAA